MATREQVAELEAVILREALASMELQNCFWPGRRRKLWAKWQGAYIALIRARAACITDPEPNK